MNTQSSDRNMFKADPQLNFLAHLTLSISTTCLVESESQFVPGFLALLPLFYALLWISFAGKGGRTLSPLMTNLIGLSIAGVGTGWVVFKVNMAASMAVALPMPTALVPLVGPILGFLVMLRLFGTKGRRDFWVLQGMGILQVSLACVLTSGTYFALLFFPYLMSLIWLLRRFQATRGEETMVHATAIRNAWIPPGSLSSVGWTLALVLLSVALFLVTPRSDTTSWNPLLRFGQSRAGGGVGSTGFSEQMNLNRTGEIEVNSDIAFSLEVQDGEGKPFLALPTEQRFRGAILEHYENGIWNRRITRRGNPNLVQTKLPFFGSDQRVMHFKVVPRKAGGLFLADPVRFSPLPFTRLPVLMDPPFEDQSYFVEQGSSVQCTVASARVRQQVGYTQVVPGKVTSDRVPAILEAEYLGDLITPRLANLEEWTIALLNDMREKSRYGLDGIPIPATAVRLSGRPIIESIHREPVARAIASYLSRGGDFTYTLEIRREDPSLDPVVDFLFNVKKGHCERYASGLVLMLRSLGIPSRVIKGFRGCESQDNGGYVVRNSQAHSWAEVLVPRLNAQGALQQDVLTGRPIFDWLTLDPTPDVELEAGAGFSLLKTFLDGLDRVRIFWRDMIMDYNSDQQAEFWQRILPDFGSVNAQKIIASMPKILLGMGITLLAGVGLVLGLPSLISSISRFGYVRQKPAQKLFRSLVDLSSRFLNTSEVPGQTPLEFAHLVQARLVDFHLEKEYIQLPERIVSILYEVRFGLNQLPAMDIIILDQTLAKLRRTLRLAERATPRPVKEPSL